MRGCCCGAPTRTTGASRGSGSRPRRCEGWSASATCARRCWPRRSASCRPQNDAASSLRSRCSVVSRRASRSSWDPMPDSSPSSSPALSCESLSHRYGDFLALDGVDLRIERGEIFGLLGPNGAGKTTTIRIANTLLPVQEGRIEVLGFDVGRAKMAVRRRIGYVPQQLSIEAALTGRQNVTWFARLFDVPRAYRAERVADALELMGLTEAAGRLA